MSIGLTRFYTDIKLDIRYVELAQFKWTYSNLRLRTSTFGIRRKTEICKAT